MVKKSFRRNILETFDVVAPKLLVLSVLLNIILIGALLNMLTITMNDGKMPVYTNSFEMDERHSSFTEPSQVKLFILTDIMSVNLKAFILYFSIGDIFVVGGLFFVFVYSITILVVDSYNLLSDFIKMRGRNVPLYKKTLPRIRPRR
jgi:hypothetical protein